MRMGRSIGGRDDTQPCLSGGKPPPGTIMWLCASMLGPAVMLIVVSVGPVSPWNRTTRLAFRTSAVELAGWRCRPSPAVVVRPDRLYRILATFRSRRSLTA
jgi:hypothetical protein